MTDALKWYDDKITGEDKEYWLKPTTNGHSQAMETCANAMDPEIREDLHAGGGHWLGVPEDRQERMFLRDYCDRHLEKYGEEFVIG